MRCINPIRRSLQRPNRSTVLIQQRAIFDDFKVVFNNTVSDIRGSVIEVLGRRMSKKDAQILNKYVDKLYSPSATPIETTIAPSVALNTTDNSSKTVVEIDQPKLAQKKIEVPPHPVFGKKIADLGYKSVYVTNIRNIAMCSVWEKQRILRPDRAAKIATSKIRNGSQTRLSGVITLFHDMLTNKIGVVDGQHRIGALILLAQKGLWDENEYNILLDVFHTTEESQVISLFKEINSAEPVRLIDLTFEDSTSNLKDLEDDLAVEASIDDSINAAATAAVEQNLQTSPDVVTTPTASKIETTSINTVMPESVDNPVVIESESLQAQPSQSVSDNKPVEVIPQQPTVEQVAQEKATKTKTRKTKKTEEIPKKVLTVDEVKKILTESVDNLVSTYPAMFKPTSRCRPPHLHADVLRDDLYQFEFIAKHNITSTEDMIRKLETINSELASKFCTIDDSTPKSMKAAIEKAQQYKFYLGLERNWISN